MSTVLSDMVPDVDRPARGGSDLASRARAAARAAHDVVVERGLQLAGFVVIALAALLTVHTR